MTNPSSAWRNSSESPSSALSPQDFLRLAIIAAAYFAANKVALFFPDAEMILAAAWPAAGVGLAALLLSPRRLWPAILAAVFLAGNAANLVSGRPLANSLGFMAANVLENLACAWFMLRVSGQEISFARSRDVGALVLAAGVVNAATGLLGAGTAALAGGAPFWAFWKTWWVADGLGILLVTPLVVAWAQPGPPVRRSPAYTAECVIFFALWCALVWLTFQPHGPSVAVAPQPYMLLATLAWPAFRMGLRTVSLALAALAAIAALSPDVQLGPLQWGGESVPERLLQAQLFIACVAATAYLLTALITERRQSEQSLRESKFLLSSIIEGTPDAIYATDAEGRFLMVNSAGAAMCGRTPEEFPGLDKARFFPPEEARRMALRDREAMDSGRVFTVEEAVTLADGLPHCFVATRGPLRGAEGRITGTYGIARDVTESRRAQEALAESEERFRTAFEQAAVGFFHGAQDGRFLRVNQKFCDIVGYSREELLQLTFRDITCPDDLPRDEEQLERLAAAELGAIVAEKRYRRKDGSLVWASRAASPVCDETGKLKYVLGVVEDISSRKRAEELREQIEHTIRHDLRAPAGSAVNLARLLRDETCLPDDRRRLLDTFEQAGRAMLDTLNSTLDLFRIETGQFQFTPARLDPLEMLREVARLLEAGARRPDVAIRVVPPEDGAPVFCLGQANLLRMALQNLLINALDASPVLSEVEASVSAGERCRITIRNKGVVPAGIRAVFFEKYVTCGKAGGTGIGTYSARSALVAMGGEVSMRSSDESGETVLTVFLPLVGPAAGPRG